MPRASGGSGRGGPWASPPTPRRWWPPGLGSGPRVRRDRPAFPRHGPHGAHRHAGHGCEPGSVRRGLPGASPAPDGAASPGAGVSALGTGSNDRAADLAAHMLPLGTGLALMGLGLGFIGVRLRRGP
ncbi:hypothetical protein [Streptomyces cirratus]|uniref:hypothetical protein n=1 Tax=Streptomyces cirratus TaxID=68187 RepID=UPI00361BFC56